MMEGVIPDCRVQIYGSWKSCELSLAWVKRNDFHCVGQRPTAEIETGKPTLEVCVELEHLVPRKMA
jgi:hypothetical protein